MQAPVWRRYLRVWRPDVRGDVDDELRFHLEMREREMLDAGLAPGEARERARRRWSGWCLRRV